mgnify:CR=1 FL=1
MQKYRSREDLRSLVIEAFSKQTEVTGIYVFGKEIEGKTDKYSDIDMVICSKDLARTQDSYLKIFSRISPVIGTFLLNSTETDLSQMIMLEGFSPYQKIDFSITDDIEKKRADGFGPFVCVYQDEAGESHSHTKMEIIYRDRVSHQVEDFLFSIPRFTKCLFRKDYDMYRRWKRTSNQVMVLLYEKYFGWEDVSKNSLSIKEISALNQLMSAEDKEAVKRIFPASGIVNIAESYESCLELLITLCRRKAKFFQISLDDDFILYMDNFLHIEIIRHIKNGASKEA